MGNCNSGEKVAGEESRLSTGWTVCIVIIVILIIAGVIAGFHVNSSCSNNNNDNVIEDSGESKCKTSAIQTEEKKETINDLISTYNKPIKLSQQEKQHKVNQMSKEDLINKYKVALNMRETSNIIPRSCPSRKLQNAVNRIHLTQNLSADPRTNSVSDTQSLQKKARNLVNQFRNSKGFMPAVNPNIVDAITM